MHIMIKVLLLPQATAVLGHIAAASDPPIWLHAPSPLQGPDRGRAEEGAALAGQSGYAWEENR